MPHMMSLPAAIWTLTRTLWSTQTEFMIWVNENEFSPFVLCLCWAWAGFTLLWNQFVWNQECAFESVRSYCSYFLEKGESLAERSWLCYCGAHGRHILWNHFLTERTFALEGSQLLVFICWVLLSSWRFTTYRREECLPMQQCLMNSRGLDVSVWSAFVMLARLYPWGWCLRLEMSGRVNALHLESGVERLHCSTSIGWNWFFLCLGQEEFRYTKPHPDATFLVCDERSVSGLFHVNFGHALFMFLMIPWCNALHIRVLGIGEDGKIMILEQNTVLISDCNHRISVSSVRPGSCLQSFEAGHWLAYEGRWQSDRLNIERERLCFRCCSTNVLTSDFHAWEVNSSVAGENWMAWPMTCRSRWT